MILITIAAALYLPRLAARDLWNPNEPGYAQAAREMSQSGQFLYPTTNGIPRGEKPAPYYWLILSSARLCGGVNEAAARLPSAAFAIALVLLTFVFARELMPSRESFLAALMLATCFRFSWQARWAEPDIVLSFFVTLAMYLFWRALDSGRPRRLLCAAAYLAAVMASLIKGPIGLAIPILSLSAYVATGSRVRDTLARLMPVLGAAIIVVVLVPFYWIAGHAAGAGYLHDLLIHQNLTRFISGFDHRQPVFYYIYISAIDLMPFSPFVFAGVAMSLLRVRRGQDETLRFVLCWCLAGFVFLSLSSSKREVYLLPLYPAAAILAAVSVAAWRNTKEQPSPLLRALAALLCGLLGIAAVAALILAIDPFGVAARIYSPAEKLGFPIYEARRLLTPLVGLTIVSFAGVLWAARRNNGVAFVVISAAASAVAMAYVQIAILPALNAYKSARAIGERIAMLCPPEGRFGGYSPVSSAALVDRMFLWDGYLFYSARLMTPLDDQAALQEYLAQSNRVIVVMKIEDYNNLSDQTKSEINDSLKFRVGHKSMLLAMNRRIGHSAN